MMGVEFNGIHSYRDLNLILSEIIIPPATPKTNYVDIPGGDGSVDLTEALGEVKYKDRECSFTFTVFKSDDFEQKKREISNLLNGKKVIITVDKDPGYYWEGRCSIDEYKSDRNIHKIVVGAIVAPYKLRNVTTTVLVAAGTNVSVTLENSRKRVIPTIRNTATSTIVFNGNAYTIEAGTHKVLDIELLEGSNEIVVTSTGSTKFVYQEGDL